MTTARGKNWLQSIRVILEDIQLTNENLLELKQFKPNEQVMVEIKPLQLSFDDRAEDKEILSGEEKEESSVVEIIEGEPEDLPESQILKSWNFT
ncbi:hypothetical protein JOC37_002594 [Desulfohalotomaculum tongense]|uniref:hypothetical protein n=1 Tax=Desulforadius tongensis TaxID=1216062 RepID=UPI00195CC5C4|nr:hypothetical protein [Desulforadius tongensis]MBM7856161.1 hypothetical protein [Desulforadius tongensis]